jgi:hypothetical protein
VNDADSATTTGRSAQESFSIVAPPSVALPKGGGAIRGIGETFAAQPVTGTASMSVPISAGAGRGGFGPDLSLSYDSWAGNVPFWFGWHLGLPAITRRTDRGLPRYADADDSDVFVIAGAEDLVPVLVRTPAGDWKRDTEERDGFRVDRYRPRVEGLFSRIERWARRSDGHTHWRTISKDDVTSLYGTSHASRVADPADPNRVFSWLICEQFDDKGNALVYEYIAENSAAVATRSLQESNRTDTERAA